MSKNLYLIQSYELNICQVMTFSLYAVYKNHEIMKIGKSEKNSKFSKTFAVDCMKVKNTATISRNSLSIQQTNMYTTAFESDREKIGMRKLH